MANPKSELRALALTAASAYRTKTVNVPEWNNTTVTLREPSGEAWLRFREFVDEKLDNDEEAKLTVSQQFLRNKRADVILFVDVLGDESGHRVFSDEDRGVVEEIYGPVHARLLRQAIELGISQDDAEKK
ncbi:phage tail assembly chaperone [Atlantibacter hermannii]|uniref:phage tail assembly chaperone n=1 Tax=Atlantibacter hermannii TaxID=565 RepID=UPI0028A7F9FB|nr:phage tail assembly chaperone [Atlantibacter hermannii]